MTRCQTRGVAIGVAVACALALAPVQASEPTDFAEWRALSFYTIDAECAVRGEPLQSAGEGWTLDVCERVPAAAGQSLSLRVVDDELYVQAGEHVLALDPESGAVRRQWLGGLPEPKDPGPGPRPKKSGCDCTLAPSAPPAGLALLGLALVLGAGLRKWTRSRHG
jgi:MYXO-CTERM domain-containing protein